jgi:polysaccharide biosynthesis protein PslG
MRFSPLFAAVLLVGTFLTSPGAGAQTAADPRLFSQTGYRVDNDPFWSFFQARGGVRTFGYPVSGTFKLDGFPVQIFQRIVLQLQPDGSVSTLNLLDPGLMPYTRINGSTFPAPDPAIVGQTPSVSDPDYATKIIQFTQDNAPDVVDGNQVNFFQTFSTTVSYDDAFPNGDGPDSLVPLFNLQIWGAPTSKPAVDPNNHNFIYQRFQRGIMHYDATCNCTQGLLLADYLKAVLTGQNLPPDLDAQAKTSKYYKQYVPGQPLSIARPNELVGSDLTNAFVPGATPTQAANPTNASPTTPSTPAQAGGNFAYGFQVQLWDFNPDAKKQVMGMVQQAGFNWAKHQVEWATIEPKPGQYDWTQLDGIVNAAAAANLKVLLSVQHAPAFDKSPSSGLFPSDPNTYKAFMQTVATRYKGKVTAYEIWNEENLAREAGPGNVDPSHYLPILEAGATGVRAGDPSAMVLLGAPSPTGVNSAEAMDDVQYLNALYAINNGEVKQFYDALSTHPSGFSNPPDCTPQTPQCSLSGGWNNDPSFFAFTRVSQYRDVMVKNGESAKKIWFSEFGYCSGSTPPPGYEYCKYLTAQNQADFLVGAFQKARALDYVGGMVVWNLNFQFAVPATDEKWGFGVIRDDWTPRPAYSALAQMPKS